MWIKILLLFFVFSFLFRTDHSFDQDFGRHLKIGEIIAQSKQVPLTNLFSYTYPDFPFINSHWLFEVLVYLGQQTIGLQALLVLKVAIFLLAVYLVLAIIPKKQYLLLPIGFIFLHTLRERPELRPEILSFLFTALTLFILEKFTTSSRGAEGDVAIFLGRLPQSLRGFAMTNLIFLLPLIQLVWVNSHIYFIVGLILQAIFLLQLGYQYLRFHLEGVKLKLLGIVFVLSALSSMINPAGLKAVLNPFTVSQNYGYTIVENQTMFLLESINFRNPNFLFVKTSAAIIIFSVVFAFFRKRLNLKNLGLSGFSLALAMMNVRSFPYLALISLPAVLENLGAAKSNFWKILTFISVPLLILESIFYLNGSYSKFSDSDTKPGLEFKESGKKAMDFVLENNLPQPIFNNFDIGSYITYRGWPKYRIFVDGRPEGYPKEFFQQVYIPAQADPQKFKELDQKYDFKTIIFSHTDQTPWGKAFLQSITSSENFKTVYLDDFMIVLVRNSVLASQGPALQTIDLTKLNPASFNFDNHRSYLNLSIFSMHSGNQSAAATFAAEALKLFPQSPVGNALFGINVQNKFFW